MANIIRSIQKRLPGGYSAMIQTITKQLHAYYERIPTMDGIPGTLIVGLSGGIDSAVTAALAVRAVGKDHVIAVSMPDAEVKSHGTSRAIEVTQSLGIRHEILPITGLIDHTLATITRNGGRASISDANRIGNIASRLRITILYDIQRTTNGRVLGTENRSEYVQGYATKYGTPASCDFGVLNELYKTDIIAIAKRLHIPASVITATPSTDFFTDQSHESELGASMDDQDSAAYLLFEKGLSVDEIAASTQLSKDYLTAFTHRFHATAHKRFLKQPHITLGLIPTELCLHP